MDTTTTCKRRSASWHDSAAACVRRSPRTWAIDVIAGVAGAAAVVCALIARRRGVLSTARASLAAVGQYVQYPFMFERCRLPSVGRGIACRGLHRLHQCRRAADGRWLFVAGPPMPPLGQAPSEAAVVAALAQDTPEAALRALGLTVVPLAHMARVRAAHTCSATTRCGLSVQFVRRPHHPIGGCVVAVGPVAMRMGGQRLLLTDAPKYGAHTMDVLHALGMTRVLRPAEGGPTVARCAWSRQYMPFTVRCDVCGQGGRAMVSLRCDHKFCFACIDGGGDECPVCAARRTNWTWGGCAGATTGRRRITAGGPETDAARETWSAHSSHARPTEETTHADFAWRARAPRRVDGSTLGHVVPLEPLSSWTLAWTGVFSSRTIFSVVIV